MLDLEGDKRPQRHGWAPGNYFCRCHDCKEQFIGDKRAILCAPCAYMRPPNPTPRPETEDRDQIALDAAHQIEALPSDLHENQRTARIQLIVLAAMGAPVSNGERS